MDQDISNINLLNNVFLVWKLLANTQRNRPRLLDYVFFPAMIIYQIMSQTLANLIKDLDNSINQNIRFLRLFFYEFQKATRTFSFQVQCLHGRTEEDMSHTILIAFQISQRIHVATFYNPLRKLRNYCGQFNRYTYRPNYFPTLQAGLQAFSELKHGIQQIKRWDYDLYLELKKLGMRTYAIEIMMIHYQSKDNVKLITKQQFEQLRYLGMYSEEDRQIIRKNLDLCNMFCC